MARVNGEAGCEDAVQYADELMAFATAVASRDEAELALARERLLAASNARVLVDAAAVAANFQRMVRIADATGIPLDRSRMSLHQPSIDALDLRRFESSKYTPL